MSYLSRRDMVGLLAMAPLATAFKLRTEAVRAGRPYAPTFFTPHEYETVKVLTDLIIPKDERSGSATEAGAPEFMDFILTSYPDSQPAIRGGLAWLDNECRDRFNLTFITATPEQRTAILDDIAWPAKARPEMSHGVAFFNRFRDMTASAFFSSKMGVADLQYQGNTFVPQWTGCPPEALAKLGVKYS